MFIKLTSVQSNIDGDIYINTESIVSVFQTKVEKEDGTNTNVTIVFGGQNGNWEVKETPSEIYSLLS
jgi:hypothetical protein